MRQSDVSKAETDVSAFLYICGIRSAFYKWHDRMGLLFTPLAGADARKAATSGSGAWQFRVCHAKERVTMPCLLIANANIGFRLTWFE